MARVLITGASGLIGSRVVKSLSRAQSDEIIALRSADVDLLGHDAWQRALDKLKPDVVLHLAWSASALPNYRDHEDNLRWAESTIEATSLALDRGIRFLATGTSVDDMPLDDVYSRSKANLRAALANLIAVGEIAWLRPFYVFDEDRPSPAVLRAALAANADGKPVRLANPLAQHDFVHSRDVGDAIVTIIRSGLMGALDIGSGRLSTVSGLVEAFGCDWVADGPPSPAASSNLKADVWALRAAGWVPAVTNARLVRSA